jgi:hypothetical protein
VLEEKTVNIDDLRGRVDAERVIRDGIALYQERFGAAGR